MSQDFFQDFATVAEIFELATRFRHVQGWLRDDEGYLLYRLARDGDGTGAIVDIGSWMGRSTVWLAAGSKAAGRERVHAVDVFDGGPMLKQLDIIQSEGTTYHRFAENLEGLGLFDHVEPVMADSREAARRWNAGAIRLLFIDGDHNYAAVKADFDLWSPHVPVGGFVVFDDAVEKHPGVWQFLQEVLADSEHWQPVLRVGKTQTFHRVG